MKRFIFFFIIVVSLVSCKHSNGYFYVKGNLQGADNDMIYLDHLALGGTETCDSALLVQDGEFKIKAIKPEYQDVYALRTVGHRLILVYDSIDCIYIEGRVSDLENAQISNSSSSADIQLLRKSLKENDIATHKDYACNLIIRNPLGFAAYYALFQQQNGAFVLNPYDKQDQRYFSAVATSWNVYMPEYERSKALYKLTLDAINQRRKKENSEIMRQFIAQSENAFLEIELPDEKGDIQRLSQYKGQVTILEFSAIEMEQSSAYIFELKELYNKYNKRGLQIYSVSADRNRLLWENSAANLPWTTVRGENGVFETAFQTYNVQSLPTLFLINRKGEVVARYSDFKSLDAAVDKCLR